MKTRDGRSKILLCEENITLTWESLDIDGILDMDGILVGLILNPLPILYLMKSNSIERKFDFLQTYNTFFFLKY